MNVPVCQTISIEEAALRTLLAENKHLRKQVDELQAHSTDRLERSLARTVRTFMVRIGHAVRHTPALPKDEEVRLRLRLVAEEFFEMLDAALKDNHAIDDYGDIHVARGLVSRAVDTCNIDLSMVDFVDALADLDYVIEGSRAAFGVDGAPIAAEVHRANMAKLDGGRLRPDGKFLKPEGWKPPDIAGVLREQGWKGP